MTKAYKVVTGIKGNANYNGSEVAKYFFDKKEAEKFYKEGERTFEITAIYTTHADGTITRGIIGATFYEEEVKNARENERVVKETVVENDYRMVEIEIN